MRNRKKTITTLLTAAILLIAVFVAGRYGWKLLGFRACEEAGVESVEVSETTVTVKGFCPGSFPEGFCGYYAEEQDGTLFVGFRFSAVFGFFKTEDFEVSIPHKGRNSQSRPQNRTGGKDHLDGGKRRFLRRPPL